MSGRYFFDTNVFVYRFDHTAPAKAARADALIKSGLDLGNAVISYQVVQEFCNVITRKILAPLRSLELEAYLFKVFRPLLAIESSMWLFGLALELQRDHRLAWYDALIVAAAQEAECGILYSEDFQHGRRFGTILVQNPFELL